MPRVAQFNRVDDFNRMNRFLLLLALSLAIYAAACSSSGASSEDATPGTGIPYTPPDAVPAGFSKEMCVFGGPDQGLIFDENALEEAIGVRHAWAVEASVPDIWFLAADMEVAGYDGPGPVAVWWSRSTIFGDYSPGRFVPYNAVAEQFFSFEGTRFEPEPGYEGLPAEVTGADYAEECALSAERENPDEPVSSELLKAGRWFRHSGGFLVNLIVQVNGTDPTCQIENFEPAFGVGPEYVWSGWERSEPFRPYDLGFSACATEMWFNETDHPLVLLETVPQEIRHLIDPEQVAGTPGLLPEEPHVTPADFNPLRCEELFESLNESLAESLITPGASVRAAHYVVSDSEDVDIAFIAAELEGPGLEGDTQVAIWVAETDYLLGFGINRDFVSMNRMAVDHFDFKKATDFVPAYRIMDGHAEVVECVHRAIQN